MISATNQRRLVAFALKCIAKRTIMRTDRYSYTDGEEREGVLEGCANMFFRLTENWGVKVSKLPVDKKGIGEAESVFKTQQQAHAIGCGPYCFGFFKAIDKNGNACYGYITEIVTIYSHVKPWEEGNWKLENDKDSRLKHLKNKLSKKMNFPFHDSHAHNIGLSGRRKRQLVCIDFGNEGN